MITSRIGLLPTKWAMIPGQVFSSLWQTNASARYVGAPESTKAIAFYRFTSGTITALYTPAKTISFIGPALTVSPEERLILFGQIERSEDEIMLLDLETLW